MNWDWVETRLQEKGLSYRRSGAELQLDCPYCGDLRQHLYLNCQKGVWICFRCDARGQARVLLKELGIAGQAPSLRRRPKPQEWPSHPLDVQPLGRAAREYLLRRRRLGEREVKLWRLVQGAGAYQDFILWPLLDGEGTSSGWHGRRFRMTGQKAVNVPPGMDRSVLGLHLVPQLRPRMVLVVEGPYDAAHVTRLLAPERALGLALLGTTMTRLQALQLSNLRLPLLLMLDSDAWGTSLRMARELGRWAGDCRPVRLERGDPDDLSRAELLAAIGG